VTSVDREFFRTLVSRFPSGVTVVTAAGPDGKPHGATVSAFSSMSMTPPLVIVSLQTSGRMAAILGGCSAFAVNILREDQKEIALKFARPGDRFEGIEVRECDFMGGVPLLCDSLATILCRSHGEPVAIGDHTVFIGEVIGGIAREGDPLIHGLGRFACMRDLPV
jgi:flavin reductase (DIM6/NTAB) family NADH-FMN oxidoreductase RutF